jgi:hypothetical protein
MIYTRYLNKVTHTLYVCVFGVLLRTASYIPYVIHDLSQLQAETQNTTILPSVSKLLHRAWEEVATHFHPPTRQWAGPHSRNYESIIRPANLALIQRATNEAVSFEDVDMPWRDEVRVPVQCPPDLVPYFTSLTAVRLVFDCD